MSNVILQQRCIISSVLVESRQLESMSCVLVQAESTDCR